MTNPSAVNRRKYECAQQMVAKGAWRVDQVAGVIHSTRYQRPLKPDPIRNGYLALAVWVPEVARNRRVLVHRVIWEAVHGPIPDGLQINHRDGDKAWNGITNLELATQVENIAHAHATGLFGSDVTDEQRAYTIHLIAEGYSIDSIAKAVGTSYGSVQRIRASQPGYVKSQPFGGYRTPLGGHRRRVLPDTD